MPELPDIVIYIEALEKRILGQVLEKIRLVSPFLLRTTDPPLGSAEGKRVRELRRVGKRIAIGMDSGQDEEIWLVLHLMIAGRLHWQKRGAKVSRPRGLAAFDFSNGTLVWTEAGSQKRASLHVVRGEAGLRALDPGGLEVLEADIDRFSAVLTAENHTLKRALTDPRLFSGIGNAYSDEILFEARLSPLALTQKLKREEIERLFAGRASHAHCAGYTSCAPKPATAFRKRSRPFARTWPRMDAIKSLACAAARKSSASAMRPTKPTIARTARPMGSCWPIALYRVCCARTGRGLPKNWSC